MSDPSKRATVHVKTERRTDQGAARNIERLGLKRRQESDNAHMYTSGP